MSVVATSQEELVSQPVELQISGERVGRHGYPVGRDVHLLLEILDLVLHLCPVTLKYAWVVPNDVPHSLHLEMLAETLRYEGGVRGVQGETEKTSQH